MLTGVLEGTKFQGPYGIDQITYRHSAAAAAAAASLQSCPTLCDPIDSSPPGSSIPGILQARIREWVAISFSNACMPSCCSHVRLCVTPWTAAHQAPLSKGFSRQEYWSGLPLPSPTDILDRIKYLQIT